MTYLDVTFEEFKQTLEKEKQRIRKRKLIGYLVSFAIIFIIRMLCSGWISWILSFIAFLSTFSIVYFGNRPKEVFFRITLNSGEVHIRRHLLL